MAAVVVSLSVPSLGEAATARLRVQGRFRDAPGVRSTVLEQLPAGTTVEVLEVLPNQWRRVQLADGRTGYVWKDHFALEDLAVAAEPEPQEAVAPAAPPADAPAHPPADQPAPEANVPPAPPAPAPAMPASIEDLEALRSEVRRLAATQQDMLARLEARMAEQPSPLAGPISGTPIDGTAGAAALFMLVGAVLAWVMTRLARRRRDRRTKIRL